MVSENYHLAPAGGGALSERQASRPMADGIWAWQPIGALWAVPAGEGGGAGASRIREAARGTPPPAEGPALRSRPGWRSWRSRLRAVRCGASREGGPGVGPPPVTPAPGFPRPVLLPVATTPGSPAELRVPERIR